MQRLAALLLVLGICYATTASAVTCKSIRFEDTNYTICETRRANDDLRLYLADETGAPYGHFAVLGTALAAQNKALVFAMNAGMYHADRAPVGHYVEDGQEKMRVVANASPGNFGLLPNGILCIQKTRFDVIETRAFLAAKPDCVHATQSGPMLVIDGQLHPRFLENSTSRFIRNGVGTSPDGQRAIFAISETPVTFHAFGRLFRDVLDLPNALFLDGNISRLHATDLSRSDIGRRMGPIVAVTAPKSN